MLVCWLGLNGLPFETIENLLFLEHTAYYKSTGLRGLTSSDSGDLYKESEHTCVTSNKKKKKIEY